MYVRAIVLSIGREIWAPHKTGQAAAAKMFHVKRIKNLIVSRETGLFSNAKVRKDDAEQVLCIYRPGNPAKRPPCKAQIFR